MFLLQNMDIILIGTVTKFREIWMRQFGSNLNDFATLLKINSC